MLGIIGAMSEEVAKIKECLDHVMVETRAGMEFYQGSLEGKPVVVVRSGIGKVNGAICTQILADCYQVEGIVNTGIAGSLRAEINIGDIVLSTDALQHDVDATVFGYQVGQIPQMECFSFPSDEKLRSLAESCCHRVNPDIRTYSGRVVSGDQFISSKEKKQWLAEHFQGYCTEMEGAAIAQTAWLNQIPVLIVRAISDKADDSATMDYETFEAAAIARSVNLLLEMIKRF